MSTWPLVKFVDSPSASAAIRFDCNDLGADAPRRVAEFDPGVPTLEGDPDAVGQQWGFRSPSILQRVKGSKADALLALSALSREQLRRTNWLMFQLDDATQPVFLKLYRTGYESLSLDRVYVDPIDGDPLSFEDTWEIRVPLVADAFAYGERVTIATTQVVQSPADLTTPTRLAMRVPLGTLKGDAPTGLRVTVTPAATAQAGTEQSSWLVACNSGESAMAAPVIDIGTGDTHTAGTGTGSGTSDTNYFNGSYRAVTIGAGAGNVLQRLTVQITTAVPLGRYKVLLRCEADAPASTTRPFLFYFGYHHATLGPTWINKVRLNVGLTTIGSAQTFQGWVDLGDISFPRAMSFPTDVGSTSGSPPALALGIGTADGSAGAVRLDAIKLIPVDGWSVTRSTVIKGTWPSGSQPVMSSIAGNFDADSELYWQNAATPAWPTLQGGFPIADPAAAQSFLTIMALSRGFGVVAAAWITSKDAQAAVDVSYHPKYLHIGDGT